jgi:hypothetical protein
LEQISTNSQQRPEDQERDVPRRLEFSRSHVVNAEDVVIDDALHDVEESSPHEHPTPQHLGRSHLTARPRDP